MPMGDLIGGRVALYKSELLKVVDLVLGAGQAR